MKAVIEHKTGSGFSKVTTTELFAVQGGDIVWPTLTPASVAASSPPSPTASSLGIQGASQTKTVEVYASASFKIGTSKDKPADSVQIISKPVLGVAVEKGSGTSYAGIKKAEIGLKIPL